MFVVFDAVLQNLHPIHLCCRRIANCCLSMKTVLGDMLCCSCGVLSFDGFHLRVLCQELAALHESYRVGVDFGYRVPVVIRKTTDAVLYVKLVLTDNRRARHAKQLIVVEQAPRNSVLYSEHRYYRGVVLDTAEYILEGVAADKLQLFSGEVLMSSYVVETAKFSLYCYSFHTQTKNGPAP